MNPNKRIPRKVHLPLRGQKTTVGGAWITFMKKFNKTVLIMCDSMEREIFLLKEKVTMLRLCALGDKNFNKRKSSKSPRQAADLKGEM